MRSLALSLGLLIAAPALADEVRMKDGTVYVGSVKVKGQRLEIQTRDGTVRVDREAVLRIRNAAELARALSDMATRVPDTGFGRLELARIAQGWGLETELWRHLDAAMALTADDRQQRLMEFLATLEAEILPRRYRDRPAKDRVRAMLRVVRTNRPAKSAAVEELLVREPDADAALVERARKAVSPAQRMLALSALARRGLEGSLPFVYRTAIIDNSEQVRIEAMNLARQHGDSATAVQYLAPGLLHGNPNVRIRTAKAYGNLEDVSAVKLLVEAGPNAGVPPQGTGGGGAGVRAHAAFTQQTAYIRDFNVEVAQASFIADPVVDVIQSGTVIDVTVAAVVTHRIQIVNAYRGALRTLVDSDPGANPKRWEAWLKETADNGGR